MQSARTQRIRFYVVKDFKDTSSFEKKERVAQEN